MTCLTAILAALLGLAACNPVETWRDWSGASKNDPDPETTPNTQNLASGEASDYPNLATVPPPPVRALTVAEREKLTQSLIADRTNAKYSAEKLVAGFGAMPGAAPPPPPPPVAEPAALPQYYTVQLVVSKRDCFWRIAGFPFVYNDPWKWRLLYDANKSLLSKPGNPNLIEPGQRFVIPSASGEKREGDYDPTVEYPTYSPK